MRTEYLPFSPPFLGDEELEAVSSVLRSGWLSRGPRTQEFEEAFAARIGANAALGVSSCTAALHLALLALDVGPADEVIVPTMTFCASANVVEHVGAKPVFVDVEADTLNVDPAAVEAAVGDRTRAILVVHYAGHPARMDELSALADRHGLAVVEDAAHALPARYRGRWVGSGPNLTAFSFYVTKNVTTGEGGMLTGDPDLVAKARTLSLHGMTGSAWNRYQTSGGWHYEVVAPGFKYNMTDVQAALGMCQLNRLSAMQARRREIHGLYDDALAGVSGLRRPIERSDVESALHLYPIRLEDPATVTRERFIEGMHARKIATSVHFIPLHLQPFYRDKYRLEADDFPEAQSAYQGLASLPFHPGLSDDDVEEVIHAVIEICGGR